jgi:hypothetical protein
MAPTIFGFPYMMRPDVPAGRIHAIRYAMMRVFEDPAFREERPSRFLDMSG